jgi:hypothetical protein
VVVDCVVSLRVARSARGAEPVLMVFGSRVMMNAGPVALAARAVLRPAAQPDHAAVRPIPACARDAHLGSG